ncbi:MAG: M15 family metallopeptidase [Synergistaceae bacterium]|nr:M15 family metallopeptidase [Synergistaceae bacterium]
MLIENHEPLVQVSMYPERILTRSWYYGERLPGSFPEVWLREGVYERLIAAAESLPDNLRLVVWDGWRSYELQSELYRILLERIMSQGIPEAEARRRASVFVAIPSREPESVSGHLTGGAVDLTIADMRGHYLDMGGSFDETAEHSRTDYYEGTDSITARDNRRLLVKTMESAGFSNYASEWWHYDFGNRQWAEKTGAANAFYGYIEPPFKWQTL